MAELLAGVDLAWQASKNGSAIAFGTLSGRDLVVTETFENIVSVEGILELLLKHGLTGIAIDAPLIIRNETGQRLCEKQLSHVYGGRYASCHTSNSRLYPDATSCHLSSVLEQNGFLHPTSHEGRWQLECYPHPALIEIFELPVRHRYKKGSVDEKRQGQIELVAMLNTLSISPVLALQLPASLQSHLYSDSIRSMKGRELKSNEDLLDAIICLYIAGLFALDVPSDIFGNDASGYIYVPRCPCLS